MYFSWKKKEKKNLKRWRDIKLPCRPSSHLNILIHSLFQPWILSNFARAFNGI